MNNPASRELAPCPSCSASDFIKYGKSRNGVQIYYCKSCRKRYTATGALPGRRFPPEQVGAAIRMFFEGMSYRDIQRTMDEQYNVRPSTETLYSWVREYTAKGNRLASNFKAHTGDTWVADETVIDVDGQNLWLFDVMDRDTRYLLATHLTKTRTTRDAEIVMRKALRRASRKPDKIVTDGLRSYIDGIEKVFGADTRHVVSEGIRSSIINNNLIERLQGTIKERTKVMRGLYGPETARPFVDGFTLHYNFMRPHESLRGKTPSQAAGIPLDMHDWIRVAKLRESTLTLEEPFKVPPLRDETLRPKANHSPRLRDRTFRRRSIM